MNYEYSRDYINAELARRLDDLCRHLGLEFTRKYGLLWVKNPDRLDGGNFHSFSISPSKRMWKDFHAGKGGDLVKLIEVYARQGSYGEAIGWALDYLGLKGKTPDPIERARAQAETLKHDADETEKAKKRRAQAWAIWLGGTPIDGTDPASRYLLERGIDVRQLSRMPSALRYVPRCWHDGQELPAMVANISAYGRGFLACHRTYLAQYGGVWGKAFRGKIGSDGEPIAAKSTLGAYGRAGGVIALSRGSDEKHALGQARPGSWVAVSEGIENTLTVALARPDWRCLCAVSGSNVGNIALPPNVCGVHVIADNDAEPQAKQMLERSIARLLERQLEVIVYRDRFGHKDMNEALLDV